MMTNPTTEDIQMQFFNWSNNTGHMSMSHEHVGILGGRLAASEAAHKEAVNRHGETLQRAYKAEATIKAVSDLISKRKFSYDERTERSGDMGALFGEIEGVVWAV